MKVARNIEPESQYPKELFLDPLDHVVRNRCFRFPEDRTILKSVEYSRGIRVKQEGKTFEKYDQQRKVVCDLQQAT